MENRKNKRTILAYVLLLTILFISIYLNVAFGTIRFSVKDILVSIFGNKELTIVESNVLFKIRFPRMIAAVIFGCALSLSGYLLQVFFRNPIAGPYVLGISSGAKLFVGIIILTSATTKIFTGSLWMSFFASAFGSILVMLIVLIISRNTDNISILLIIGIMIGYIATAITNLLIAFASENKIAGLTNWSLGSFSGMNWEMVKISIIVIIPCIIFSILISKSLSIYQFGENYAKSMGVNIKIFRIYLIILSSILSAIVTAFAGPISFVGIAVPHITRQIFKTANPKVMIPAVCLTGSVFCLFCDFIARTLFSPIELSLSTVTSFIGAPIVIYLLIRRKKD